MRLHAASNLCILREITGANRVAIQARQRGRPTKPVESGVKVTLSLRMPSDLKRRLEAAGSSSGRNLSEESERRLDGSFRAEDMLKQALDLALDRPGTGLLMTLIRVLRDAARGAAVIHGGDDWLSSPYAFDQVAKAVVAMLEGFRPAGDVAPPPGPNREKLRGWGDYAARQSLAAIVGRTENYQPQAGDFVNELDDPSVQWVRPVRERLGPVVIERIKKRFER